MSNRYLISIEKYFWADTNENAISLCKRMAKEENARYDNNFKVTSLHEAKEGKLTTKKIY